MHFSQKTIGKISIYPSKPLHIPSGEDVPSSRCIPESDIKMETSQRKVQTNTKKQIKQKKYTVFPRIALFIWKSLKYILIRKSRKTNLAKKQVDRILKNRINNIKNVKNKSHYRIPKKHSYPIHANVLNRLQGKKPNQSFG